MIAVDVSPIEGMIREIGEGGGGITLMEMKLGDIGEGEAFLRGELIEGEIEKVELVWLGNSDNFFCKCAELGTNFGAGGVLRKLLEEVVAGRQDAAIVEGIVRESRCGDGFPEDGAFGLGPQGVVDAIRLR